MSEKPKIPEQVASHDYWSNTEASPDYEEAAPGVGNATHLPARRAYNPQRVVKVPEADPVVAWRTFDQRRQEHRRERSRPQKAVHVVPRTLAQTGSHATSGRFKALRRPGMYHTSPVPTRSGQRSRRRGLLGKLLAVLAVGVLLMLGTNFLLTSSTFSVARVNVVGTQNAELVRSIQHMGVQGQNIFLLDVSRLTQRVEAQPLVASVALSKQWPNQLTLAVTERVPVLLWQTPQGSYSIDAQGAVIALASATRSANRLSTVIVTPTQQSTTGTAKQASSLRPGMHISPSDVAFARQIITSMPQLVGVSTFKLYYNGTMYGSVTDQSGRGPSGRGSYIVESPDGWKAFLGGPADTNPLDNRLMELRDILTLAQSEQLTLASIDLRYGLHPVFTLQK